MICPSLYERIAQSKETKDFNRAVAAALFEFHTRDLFSKMTPDKSTLLRYFNRFGSGFKK